VKPCVVGGLIGFINWQYGLAIFVGLEVAVGEMKELILTA
jgi:hypothetical protein